MKIKVKIQLDYKNGRDAYITFKALEPDNKGFIEGELVDNRIIFKLEGESIGSVQNTLDDLIVSEMITEKMVIK